MFNSSQKLVTVRIVVMGDKRFLCGNKKYKKCKRIHVLGDSSALVSRVLIGHLDKNMNNLKCICQCNVVWAAIRKAKKLNAKTFRSRCKLPQILTCHIHRGPGSGDI